VVWVKLDDGFVENEKVMGLHDRAFRLHVAAMCYSARNLTDGLITERSERIIGAILNVQTRRWVKELVAAKLWTPVSGGHVINDYLEYNPAADEVKAARRRNAERQASSRRRRAEARHEVDNALRNGVTDGVSHAAPSRPVPNPKLEALAPVSETHSPPSYEGGRDFTTLGKLKGACHADEAAAVKLERAARGCSEADIVAALEACRGPGVRDRLAVALSELKKRRAA